MQIYRIKKENSCCFSGYRPQKLPWGKNENTEGCRQLKKKIQEAVESVYEKGIRHFICGMALGCDTYFYEEVLKLKEKHSDVTVEAAIPYEEQAAKWSEKDRDRYFDNVAKCDVETMVNRRYTPECLLERNKYMVDNSVCLITVFDGKFGGTMHTINYARSKGIEIIQIEP